VMRIAEVCWWVGWVGGLGVAIRMVEVEVGEVRRLHIAEPNS